MVAPPLIPLERNQALNTTTSNEPPVREECYRVIRVSPNSFSIYPPAGTRDRNVSFDLLMERGNTAVIVMTGGAQGGGSNRSVFKVSEDRLKEMRTTRDYEVDVGRAEAKEDTGEQDSTQEEIVWPTHRDPRSRVIEAPTELNGEQAPPHSTPFNPPHVDSNSSKAPESGLSTRAYDFATHRQRLQERHANSVAIDLTQDSDSPDSNKHEGTSEEVEIPELMDDNSDIEDIGEEGGVVDLTTGDTSDDVSPRVSDQISLRHGSRGERSSGSRHLTSPNGDTDAQVDTLKDGQTSEFGKAPFSDANQRTRGRPATLPHCRVVRPRTYDNNVASTTSSSHSRDTSDGRVRELSNSAKAALERNAARQAVEEKEVAGDRDYMAEYYREVTHRQKIQYEAADRESSRGARILSDQHEVQQVPRLSSPVRLRIRRPGMYPAQVPTSPRYSPETIFRQNRSSEIASSVQLPEPVGSQDVDVDVKEYEGDVEDSGSDDSDDFVELTETSRQVEINTESELASEYHRQTGIREPPKAPTTFMCFHLSQGLRDLENSTRASDHFTQYCADHEPDVFALQGVALECSSVLGRSHPSEADVSVYNAFCNRFPAYNFFLSLGSHRVRGEGQLVGVKKSCESPSVTYNLSVPTDENSQSHQKDGHIVLLEFQSILVVLRIAPQNGLSDHARILKRAADDKLFHDFLTNRAAISDKPVLYAGNLNVCNHLNDMTESPHHWMEYNGTSSPSEDLTQDQDNMGLSQCTNNNRKRFKSLLVDGRLIDTGARSVEQEPLHTEHGEKDLVTDTWRTTYMCVSRDLVKAECVVGVNTPGQRDGTVGHFGSQHSPMVLKLRSYWNHRYKGTKCKVLAEHQPHFKRKMEYRKAKLAPFREGRKKNQVKQTAVLMEFLKTATLLHVLSTVPMMSSGAQYFTTHRDGEIVIPTSDGGESMEAIKFHSLWDTGASNANYMSSQFYDAHKEALEPYSTRVDTSVTLGDKKTRVNLDTMVMLTVRFRGKRNVMHEAEIPFMILESDGRDAIIGMPSLITDFGQLFKEMICESVDKYSQPERSESRNVESTLLELNQVKAVESDISELAPPEGCAYPWDKADEGECPEDKMIPEAISNDLHLEHLTQSYEAELEKFHTLLESHIDSEFMKSKPEVVDLMKKHVNCFVKREWLGLNLEAIVIKFKDTLPERLKPYTPKIPQHLLSHSEKEFKRMLDYFYVKCDSPWASPLTVAPKATDPFIRLCVNLRKINSYVDFGHFPIPNVKGTLESLLPYNFFCDIDLKSSFHQIPLSKESSEKLSVSTPWGQYRPKFVPEGLCQASQNLQECMEDMFGHLGDWCSLLFDNILIGGKTEEELLVNLSKFMECCEKSNCYLKIEKTWIGFREVKFFGYKVHDGRYYLEDSRAEAIDLIPFPNKSTVASNQTAMRSFLGQTRIFQPHVPDYTTYAAPLEKLTSAKFDWDKSTWTEDYELIFEKFKARLKGAMILFMPDFEKEWIMRTDASTTGYGGVLYQVSISPEGKRLYEPLIFISRKWSDPATRWDTFSQECFGIFACVKECAHWLRGKPFIIETDHANLRTMEQSLVPKIIRQHLYLRTFTCWVRHVAGKSNTADYWSRLHEGVGKELHSLYLSMVAEGDEYRNDATEAEILHNPSSVEDDNHDFWNDEAWLGHILMAIKKGKKRGKRIVEQEEPGTSAQELFDTVHGGKMLHQGVRRTWLLLNKMYPAHGIPIVEVQSMVDQCATCQKFRLGLRDKLTPITRVLKPPHHRRTVGVDTLTITPESDDGFKALITVVNHYTHHVFLYPVKKYDSVSLANALMQYIANFGLFDELISDPGSDLTSKAIEELNTWLGINHTISLVDVHTSNGCENTNKQVIIHLSCLCNDLRIKDKWSDPKILALIQLHFNGSLSSETGVRPFEALFGSMDEFYYTLPEDVTKQEYMTGYVKRLDDALEQLRDISSRHQEKLTKKRVGEKGKHNQFQVGDLVLKTVRTPTKHWKPQKLGPQFYGPYKVEHVNSNDYCCRHVTDGTVHEFHVDMLKPYFGTMTMAKRAALLDHDQYFVTRVSQYAGDPFVRSGMEFLLTYADGDEQWQVFRQELMDNEAFQQYVQSVPELWPLKTTDAVFKKKNALLNKEPITEVEVGDIRYVDLRSIGAHWYNGFEGKNNNPCLPSEDSTVYVVPFRMIKWKNDKFKTKLEVRSDVLDYTTDWNHEMVKSWGTYKEPHEHHTVINESFLTQHPQLFKSLASRRRPAVENSTEGRTKVVKVRKKGVVPPKGDEQRPIRRTRSTTRPL